MDRGERDAEAVVELLIYTISAWTNVRDGNDGAKGQMVRAPANIVVRYMKKDPTHRAATASARRGWALPKTVEHEHGQCHSQVPMKHSSSQQGEYTHPLTA